MSLDNLEVLIYINMCCILPNDGKISNKGWLLHNWFQNQLPLRVLNFLQRDEKLEVFLGA